MAYAENRGQVGAGFRAYTGNMQAAQAAFAQLEELAAKQGEPQEACNKNTVESALQQAQGVLMEKWGINRTHYQILQTLVWYTNPVDWEAGNLCIAYPRNTKLAEDLAVSVRTVQFGLRRLLDVGLIQMKDSPNGQRYGIRPSPKAPLSDAYGIDLSPLRKLAPVLKELAAEQREAVAHRAQLRRQIGHLCRIGQELVGAACTVLDNQAATKWQGQAADLRRFHYAARSVKETAALLAMIEQAQTIVAQIEDDMPPLPTDAEPAGIRALAENIRRMGESKCAQMNTNTETHDFSKRSTVVPSLPEGRSGSGAPSDAAEAVREEMDREKVTPELVCDAIPNFYNDMLPPDWPALLQAAYDWSRSELDIRADTWRLARTVLGDQGTAVAIATIVGRAEAVERPGAYLRGMIERAQSGKLRLGQSIWGFLRAEQRATAKASAAPAVCTPSPTLDADEPVIARLRSALMKHLDDQEGETAYATWFGPCSMRIEGETVIVSCPSRFHADCVQERYQSLCMAVLDYDYDVKFQ